MRLFLLIEPLSGNKSSFSSRLRGDPQIEINPVAVAARGVAAATIGIVLKPFTALAGAATDEEPSPCTRLLAQDAGG